MGFLSTKHETFTRPPGQMDAIIEGQRLIDKKTDELLRLALSIKARSKPCGQKHCRGSIHAGASYPGNNSCLCADNA